MLHVSTKYETYFQIFEGLASVPAVCLRIQGRSVFGCTRCCMSISIGCKGVEVLSARHVLNCSAWIRFVDVQQVAPSFLLSHAFDSASVAR